MAHLLVEAARGGSAPLGLAGEGGAGGGEALALGTEVFTIGRGTSCDLHLQDPWLSRLHAKIIPRDGDFHVADAGSRNGTYLNGRLLHGEERLADGDVIVLGDLRLRFVDPRQRSGGELRIGSGEIPLPSGSTVLIRSEELVFDRYREPPSADLPAAAEAPSPAALAGVGRPGQSLLPALTRAASALINHHPLPELVELVLDLTLETVTAERGALLLDGPSGELRVMATRGFGHAEVWISRTLIREVKEKRQAVLTLDAQSDDRFEAADSILIQGIRSIICVPLWNNHKVIGLLYLDQRQQGSTLGEDDLRVTGLIANLAAVKIENVRLLEEQIEKNRMAEQLALGAKIQRGLLPARHPDVPGYDVWGENRSCYEVGGDYFDYIRKPDGKLALVVADIAGKGVGAALLMAALQASLRALIRTAPDPAKLVVELNLILIESSPDNKFATLFYAELDPQRHVLSYVNGGHAPGLLWCRGEVAELRPTGPLVGLFEDAEFVCREVELAAGATLLLYTDGIVELEDSEGEDFGIERLTAVLRQCADCRPLDLAHEVRARLRSFGDTDRPTDDSTLMVVRRRNADER